MKKVWLLMLLTILFRTSNSQINTYAINQPIYGIGTLSFDINNDSNYDFTFDIISLTTNTLAARVVPNGLSSILDNSTYGYPDTLNYGDPVVGYFHSNTGVLGTFNNAGQFNGAGEKYLGVKINGSGNNYFGWIKLYCSLNRDTLLILSCGYNTTANYSIFAGQTTLSSINEAGVGDAPKLIVKPNPVSNQTIISTDGCFNNSKLLVYNSFGQICKSSNSIIGDKFVFDRGDLPPGIYYLELQHGKGVISRVKILITD